MRKLSNLTIMLARNPLPLLRPDRLLHKLITIHHSPFTIPRTPCIGAKMAGKLCIFSSIFLPATKH